MAELVEVPFEGGSLLFAAAGSDGPSAFTGAATVARATESLDGILDQVANLGALMRRKLASVDFDSAEASIGIKVTGKGKFIVAEASAEASLTVKLHFKGEAK